MEPIHDTARKMCIVLIALLLTLSIAVSLQQPLSSSELIPINVNVEEIQSYVKVLSSVQSRMTGYPGYYKSIDYILQELKKAGLNPELHTFYTVVPYDGESSIKLQNGYTVKAYALYPNVVALGGAKNLKGKLVYAGTGDLSELDGKEIEERIAVLEFNSWDNWLNLIQLGAKAVIFLESLEITREEALKKITFAPLDFPRLYVCGEDAIKIREAAKEGLEAEINMNYTWRRVKAYNIIAKIKGSVEPEKVIILSAHLDSVSITPALSPGAEEAVNPAFLLYIAKQLAQHKSRLRYSVWIVFFSGHWQGLSGARWFVEDYFFNESYGLGKTFYPYITLNLEISSGSSKLILNPGGAFFYGHRTVGAMNIYRYLEDSARKWIVEFFRRYPKYYRAIANDAFNYNPSANIITTTSFRSGVSVDYALPFILDSEPFALAKTPAVSFLTFKDIRLKVFTPQDTVENINWDNLKPQFAFTAYVLNKILSNINTVLKGSWESIRPTRLEVDPANGGFGYADVRVEVLEYDPTVPTLYKPVPNALVVVYKISWYYNTMGSFAVTKYNPFAYIIDQADENGQLKIVGLAPQEAFIGNVEILGYKVKDGRLTYVPDMGPNGFGKFSPAPPYLKPGITVKTVAFKAAGIFVPYTMLPDQPYPLITFNIYNKPIFPVPYTHYANPLPTSIEAFQENLVRPQSFAKIEDHQGKFALVFALPERSIQVIVSLTGLKREAVMLLNITDASMLGHGYKLGPAGTLKIVPGALIEYTRELFAISKERYERAVKQGIKDFNLEELLKTAETSLEKAEQLYAQRKYSEAYVYTFKAWSSSLQLYERVRGMYVDFTNAAVVIMLIIAPFAVIFEKFLGRENGYKRILALIVIAAFAFSVFAVLHPGFSIVYSVSALALGVILVVLVTPTLLFLYLNFNRSLGQLRRKHVGTHFLEREVFDMFIAAMSIGIENMKKRPLRTGLTLLTIILIVMSLISLTSVIPVQKVIEVSYPTAANYQGILIQSSYNEPLDPSIIPVIKGIVGENAKVSVRYWIYPAQDYFTLLSERGEYTTIRAAIGLSPEDIKHFFGELNVDLGMFTSEDAVLLPSTIASALNVKPGDIIIFNGYPLRVAGTFNATFAYMVARDIDDLAGSTEYYAQRPYDIARMTDEQRFDKSFRIRWEELIILNSKFAEKTRGAFISSIEIYLNNVSPDTIKSLAKELYKIFNKLEVYASTGRQAVIISSRFVQEAFGFNFIIIPVIIAGLVLMTTLLGGIQERIKEMSIYSSLGLAPMHVAGMFLAETLTYAILGATIGYIGGIVMSRVFNFALSTGGTVGMNYSSSSVFISLGIVVLLDLLASVYPLLLVSKLVTPSLERKWRIPTKPKGDVWEIPLPFTFREDEMVIGLTVYLLEYLRAHEIERAEHFTLESCQVSAKPGEVIIKGFAWLPPFEENIRQEFILRLSKSLTEAKYFTSLVVKRVSGAYDLWVNSAENFAREIRKQMLTWRLLTPKERDNYIERGEKMLKGEMNE